MTKVVIVYKRGDTVPKNVTKIIFDSSVIEVDYWAFKGCEQLKEVVLNEGLVNIGWWAFEKCTSLTIIKLPSTVTEVGCHAFKNCTNLREVVFNEGLQKIGSSAFYNCASLTIIKLPSTVMEIGMGALNNCTNLREMVLNEDLQEIGYEAFARCTSLEFVKFSTISKRINNLSGAGQTEIEDKFTIYQHFEWRGDEFLVSPEAINDEHWETTMGNLDHLLDWISYCELKEATTIIELAIWKAKIDETGAAGVEERSACRVEVREVPGPAKDAIIQYYG